MQVIAVFVWLIVGVVAALVMRRRGHDTFAWAVLFVFLGPLALPLAISAERHPAPAQDAPDRPASFDALAAFDGSTRARSALDAAVTLFGDAMTSLTLVTVLDTEAQSTERGIAVRASARRELEAVVAELTDLVRVPVDSLVLYGQPAHAIGNFVKEHGYELVIAGTRGRGTSRAILGSVAEQLAKHSPVPVLLCPDHEPAVDTPFTSPDSDATTVREATQ